jgi:hypothetical protein
MPQSAMEAPPAAPGWLASRDENPAVGIEAGPTFGLPRSAFGAVAETATVEMSVIDRFELEASEPVTAPITMPRVFAQAVAEDPTLLDDHVETVVAEEVVEESAAELPAPRSAAAAWSQVPVAPVAPVVEPTPPTAVIPAAAAAAPAAFTDEPLSGLQGFEALIAQASAGLEAPSVPTGQVRVPEPELERSTLPPTGHWSQDTQDDMLPFEGLLSRDVTSTGGSSRSMIMMEPQPDLMQAVNSTGEIMITGSLDLPHILSSTGAPSNHYDSSEIDRLFEASQDDHHTGNVAPVRASRAVSTHTSTRSVVGPRKRRGGTLPTVLAITAAVMAIGVIGLLFGGYVLRIF